MGFDRWFIAKKVSYFSSYTGNYAISSPVEKHVFYSQEKTVVIRKHKKYSKVFHFANNGIFLNKGPQNNAKSGLLQRLFLNS